MRLALAQINTVVGDLDGNAERIVRRLEEAAHGVQAARLPHAHVRLVAGVAPQAQCELR